MKYDLIINLFYLKIHLNIISEVNIIKKYLTCIGIILILFSCTKEENNKYLQTAGEAGQWILSTVVKEGDLLFWPSQPDTMRRGEISFYHGVPGSVLFFLELFKTTKNEDYREIAEKGAGWLISKAIVEKGNYYWSDYTRQGKPIPDAGLYTGTAGVGIVFLELYENLGKEIYKQYAEGAANWLISHAREMKNGGISWNRVTDIISGAAGTGFFLIRAAEILNKNIYLETASKVGDFLINEAVDDSPGKKWKAFHNSTRIYPNFSHGTSGISYFLALLYEKTNNGKYLKFALEGAEWLEAHEAEHSGEGHAWFHHEPDGKDLYYTGWCHGPAGTARLFYQLYKVTGEEKWIQWVKGCADWLLTCGLLEKPLEGFWNVSVCCGHAGIIDFFADLYKLTGENLYWEFALKLAEDLLDKADKGNPGLKWVQAENRTRPEEVFAQTGYSQGASGIGLTFLKLYAYSKEKIPFRVFVMPDNPFSFSGY